MNNKHFKQLVAPRLLEMEQYSTSAYQHSIKLDAMEMPDNLSELTGAEILNALVELKLNRYPDPNFLSLKKRLLKKKGFESPNIDVVIGNGSDELIQLLCLLMANDGKGKLLIPSPTFSVYKILGTIHGLQILEHDLDKDTFALDTSKFIQRIEADEPSLIFIASPNNPTGNQLVKLDIEDICRACKGLVVLDEAYYEFTDSSKLKLIESFDNLLIMQTMSKTGFAGIRLGMLFGNRYAISLINKLRLPYNVNTVSQAAGIEILSCKQALSDRIDAVIQERRYLTSQLSTFVGIKVYPSEANFILVDFGNYSADLIFSRLLRAGILVKNVSSQHQLLNGCLRITVGSKEENRKLIETLAKIIL